MKEIQLTKGYVAIVDDEDFECVNRHKWVVLVNKERRTKYVMRTETKDGKRAKVYLHRFITNPPEGMVVDHINGDGLDNRKENLRICTTSENQRNSHLHRKGHLPGVTSIKRNGKTYWMAQLWNGEKSEYLGSADTGEGAHKLYLDSLKDPQG